MIAFKSDLTEEQRWKLVAFIMSPVGPTASSATPAVPVTGSSPATPGPPLESAAASGPAEGDPGIGRDLFYDLSNQRSCHGCHAIHGVGGKVGPDLEAVASSKSAADLIASVLKPRTVTDPKFMTVTVTLTGGDKIIGVKKEESGEVLRIYDTTVLPAVLRTVPKSEIAKLETSEQSIMPADYSSTYTQRQLADIVAFIKSAAARADR
jgi:putative heme-binding domain-containing protein